MKGAISLYQYSEARAHDTCFGQPGRTDRVEILLIPIDEDVFA